MLIKKNKAEFISCNLAGFGHADGHLVLHEMHPGDKLIMVREDENKYDHEAIALFYKPRVMPEDACEHNVEKAKNAIHVGYIPSAHNSDLAFFMDLGHEDIFECVITNIKPDAHPNDQIQIRVNLLRRK